MRWRTPHPGSRPEFWDGILIEWSFSDRSADDRLRNDEQKLRQDGDEVPGEQGPRDEEKRSVEVGPAL